VNNPDFIKLMDACGFSLMKISGKEAESFTTVMSFYGGVMGIIALAVAAPLVSEFALKYLPLSLQSGSIGAIIGRLLDDNLRRAIISDQESLWILLKVTLTSPLSAVLLLLVIFILLSKTTLWRRWRGQTV
jgi:TctA family transporter